MLPIEEPAPGCPLCPRLVAFREDNRQRWPEWHNAPVPSFGPLDAPLLVIGLAPGLKGANATGRPFTGDWAGDLLFATLLAFGLARGVYDERADDGLELIGCRITNAVRCVPPANRPTPAEAAICRQFLIREMGAMARLKGILVLGGLAHDAALATLGLKKRDYPFGHGNLHTLPSGLVMADSYHCSRLNTNTGRLTEAMFQTVVGDLLTRLRENTP